MKREKILMTMLFLLCGVITSFAQPGGGGPPGGGPPVPISGIEILIAMGGILGFKKLFDSRKAR